MSPLLMYIRYWCPCSRRRCWPRTSIPSWWQTAPRQWRACAGAMAYGFGCGALGPWLWGDGYNYGAMVMAAGMAKTSKHGEDPRPRRGRESCTSIRRYQGLGASGRLAWGFKYKSKFPLWVKKRHIMPQCSCVLVPLEDRFLSVLSSAHPHRHCRVWPASGQLSLQFLCSLL